MMMMMMMINGPDKKDKEEANQQDRTDEDENQTNATSEETVERKDNNKCYCVICERSHQALASVQSATGWVVLFVGGTVKTARVVSDWKSLAASA